LINVMFMVRVSLLAWTVWLGAMCFYGRGRHAYQRWSVQKTRIGACTAPNQQPREVPSISSMAKAAVNTGTLGFLVWTAILVVPPPPPPCAG